MIPQNNGLYESEMGGFRKNRILCLPFSGPDSIIVIWQRYDQTGRRHFMEPVFYTVQNINGDYAYMTSGTGGDSQVAMFFLPEGTDVGSRLKWENFEWELLG